MNGVGRQTSYKATQLKKFADLRSQIAACDEVAQKNYMEIGKRYYEKYGEDAEAEFAKQCLAIHNAEFGSAELKRKLKDLKENM